MYIKIVSIAEAREILTNECDHKTLDSLEKTYNEVSKFQYCEMTVSLRFYESGSYEFHNTTLAIQYAPFKITISYNQQYKKYLIFADFKELPNIDRHTIEKISEQFTKPNKIGKLSSKKISEWIAYYTEIFNKIKVENENNGNLKAEFLKSIEGLPIKWTDDKRGSIVQNGIELTFEINETFVSQRLTLSYKVPNSVEVFKQLSNNNFKY